MNLMASSGLCRGREKERFSETRLSQNGDPDHGMTNEVYTGGWIGCSCRGMRGRWKEGKSGDGGGYGKMECVGSDWCVAAASCCSSWARREGEGDQGTSWSAGQR